MRKNTFKTLKYPERIVSSWCQRDTEKASLGRTSPLSQQNILLCLKWENNGSWDACLFHYTSLKVQKVQLALYKQGREFSSSFCFYHRATDLRASLTIGPCGNYPKINPACANTFKTGRISESCRKARCTSVVQLNLSALNLYMPMETEEQTTWQIQGIYPRNCLLHESDWN